MMKSVIALVLFLLVQILCNAVAMLISNSENLFSGGSIDVSKLQQSPEIMGISLFFSSLITIFLLFATKVARRPRISKGLCKLQASTLIPLLAMLLLAFGEVFLINSFGLSDNGMTEMFKNMSGNFVCLLTLCIVGPITEELVFREGVLRNFPSWRSGRLLAVVVSALAFAVVHGNPVQSVAAFASGMFFGILFVATGNIRLSSAAHILNNTLAVVSFHVPSIGEDLEKVPNIVAIPLGLLLCSMSFVLIYFWWNSRTRCRLLPMFKK